MNSTIQKLAEYFEKLPGIGPRQARRFVFSLLNKDEKFLKNFSESIAELKNEIIKCPECKRFVKEKCQICSELSRDKNKLLVVEKDIDLNNIEKTGFYNGTYFVLGGLMPALNNEMPKEILMKDLFEKVKKKAQKNDLKEIVLAFNATPEGDNTARYVEKILEPITQKVSIKISRLGRGLSTGTELEYADNDTLKNAFEKRD